MKRTKTQKGITLIALVITIILLFVLAIVAIRAVQDGGIIEYAKLASKKYKYAEAREEVEFIMSSWFIDRHTGYYEDIADYITSKFGSENVKILDSGEYEVTYRGYKFIIAVDANGNYTISDPELPANAFVYEIANGEVTITGFNFTNTNIAFTGNIDYNAKVTLAYPVLTFPNYIAGKPVTAIKWNDAITDLVFTTNTAQTIYINISGVQKIQFGDNLKSISTDRYCYVFENVEEGIVLPENLEEISGYPFRGYLENLKIPASVSVITDGALYGVGKATFEKGTIFNQADADAKNNWEAGSVIFETDKPDFTWDYYVSNGEVRVSGLNFSKEVVDNIYIDEPKYCATITLDNETLTIPDEIEGVPVTSLIWSGTEIEGSEKVWDLEDLAYNRYITIKGVKKLVFGSNIQTIGNGSMFSYIFEDLEEIVLPNNLKEINSIDMFLNKGSNVDLYVPASVTKISGLEGIRTVYFEPGTNFTQADADANNNWGAQNVVFER